MNLKVCYGFATPFLVLALIPFADLHAQTGKPFLVKKSMTMVVDGKEATGSTPYIDGLTSSGVRILITKLSGNNTERKLWFPDGTVVRVIDQLKIKFTMPGDGTDRYPFRDCTSKVLETTTINGVKANLIENEYKYWAAPSLNCVELRRSGTVPGAFGTSNRIETESIDFKEPPKELISVTNLEEVPPSEYIARLNKSRGASEVELQRMREGMKRSDEQYYKAHKKK